MRPCCPEARHSASSWHGSCPGAIPARHYYILDEPTTGLHFHDIAQLLTVLHRLRDHGYTIIEYNLDVIKTADWIIDLGPEGGLGGGEIVVAGTPAVVAGHAGSYTGQFLKHTLEQQPVDRQQTVPT